jgi:hypothetical protein
MPADSSSSGSKSSGKNLPNIYSAASGMDGYSDKPGGKSPAKPAEDSGEKVRNVTTLLEVIKKMDAAESDPENKKLLEQVAGLVEQYMGKLQPGGAGGAGASASGAGKPGGSPAGATGAGGAGATVGDATAGSAAM